MRWQAAGRQSAAASAASKREVAYPIARANLAVFFWMAAEVIPEPAGDSRVDPLAAADVISQPPQRF